jgi:hypothetical protein
MGSRSLFWFAGLVGVMAGVSLAHHRRQEAQRRASPAAPEPVQTWEAEGGAVPVSPSRTAQQVAPSVTEGADPISELESQRRSDDPFDLASAPQAGLPH